VIRPVVAPGIASAFSTARAKALSILTVKKKHGNEPLVALLIETATLHTSANLKVAGLADVRAEEIADVGARLPHGAAGRGRSAAEPGSRQVSASWVSTYIPICPRRQG
jgi:hypothetical protein